MRKILSKPRLPPHHQHTKLFKVQLLIPIMIQRLYHVLRILQRNLHPKLPHDRHELTRVNPLALKLTEHLVCFI